MTVITTGSYPKAQRPGVFDFWGTEYNESYGEYLDLFEKEISEMGYEELVESVGFGLMGAKAPGSPTTYDTAKQGETTRSTHIAYAKGFIVTKEERDDNLYEKVSGARTKMLKRSAMTTLNVLAASRYNLAFTAASAGGFDYGDLKPLIATDHPTEGGDQANEPALPSPLSEGSLEELLILADTAKDSRGLEMPLSADTLIVPPQLSNEATRIVYSDLQNDTANNAVNSIKLNGRLPGGVKVNHYLTSATAFFIRTDLADTGLIYFERNPLEFSMDNDFDTDNEKYKAYMRCSFTCGNWRAIYGNPGL